MPNTALLDQPALTLEQHRQVVDAAMAWLRTPYHHQAQVKGGGADCAMFPLAVYKECGLIPADYQAPAYSSQWHLHRSEELYIAEVEKFAVEKSSYEIQPADFVIFKFGPHVFSRRHRHQVADRDPFVYPARSHAGRCVE